MNFEEITALVATEMRACETLMQNEMSAEVPLAELVMRYAICAGGKRIRPLLLLLSAGLCQYKHQNAIMAAAFIEFIHNATLLHDDVIDQSDTRRGKESANIAFGNAAAVLVGDFLYTRAFQLMVKTGNNEVLQSMSLATNLISGGEIMQLANAHNADLNEEEYYRVIELKTAVLFSAACRSAAQLAGVAHDKIEALSNYGRLLGMAFQIADDLLDYTGKEEQLGKALGDDLAEGKPTLPLIRAQQQLPAASKQRLRTIIENGEREALQEVITLIKQTDAIQYSMQSAHNLGEQAIASLQHFAPSPYKRALLSLVTQSIVRQQ